MPDEVKVEVAPEEKDTSQEKVDVTPEAKVSEEDALAAKIKADFEQLYGSKISQVEKSFENFRHGAYRIQDELKKEVEQLRAKVQAPSAAISSTASPDPWTKIEDGHLWKSEIEKLAEQKAEEKLRAWQTQQQSQAMLQQQQQSLEGAKQKVVEKYPDLDPESGDPSTLISQTYAKVLNEHPDWTMNPYGPLLTMYEMEEQLKAAAPSGGTAKTRSAATSLPPSRPGPSGGERMTLTREQKAFCDRHQIKYEDFLKTATSLEQGAVEA